MASREGNQLSLSSIVSVMRASRLLSILLLLQSRGRLTAQQLADTLEVSVRTIYRDMGSLTSAGVPLYGDAGPAGGYQLLGGYRTRLTGLTADEAGALSMSGMPVAAAELGLGSVLAAARLKLEAALPAELRDRAARIQQRFHFDAPGWYYDRDDYFDLPGFWSSFVAEFRDRLYQRNATIRLAPTGRERLRELMSTAVSQAVDETATPPDADGWVTAVVPIESLEHAEAEFLRLGARVEIMSPDDLRKRFAAEAQRLTGLYFPA